MLAISFYKDFKSSFLCNEMTFIHFSVLRVDITVKKIKISICGKIDNSLSSMPPSEQLANGSVFFLLTVWLKNEC